MPSLLQEPRRGRQSAMAWFVRFKTISVITTGAKGASISLKNLGNGNTWGQSMGQVKPMGSIQVSKAGLLPGSRPTAGYPSTLPLDVVM